MSTELLGDEAKSEQFLVFLLKGENYSFPILKIKGIISIPKIINSNKTVEYINGGKDLVLS